MEDRFFHVSSKKKTRTIDIMSASSPPMLPSEVLMGPARTDYQVGPPGLGRDTQSWDPNAETITTYAATGLGRASRLDVGVGKEKGRSYQPGASAAFGHCPTGRLHEKGGGGGGGQSSGSGPVMTPAQTIGARSPGPIYDVSTVLDGPCTRFASGVQRPPVANTLSPGPIYTNNATLGHKVAHTYENAPHFSMQGRTPLSLFSPRPYEGPLGATLPKRGTLEAQTAALKGEIGGVCSGLGKQVLGTMKTAPNYRFLSSEQRPDVLKGPYLGKELEYGMKGRLAKDVPAYVAHSPGLATSPRFRNSPRMTFSTEPRF